MRRCTIGFLFSWALLLPNVGNAQQPAVTAQSAEWQTQNETIVVNGLVYHPTRETRFFDPQIMTQTGVYLGVPVYADVTLEPHSVLYVPVSRTMMRGYERRREGELAGTTGSRVPAFPVEIRSGSATAGEERMVTVPDSVGTGGLAPLPEPAVPRRSPTRVESVPRPRANDGIWLEYGGERWYSDGPAVVFDDRRFVQIGEYRGFPVYRDNDRGAEEIWVRVVVDGPVAPYTKR
jgi:hypothetical protein